MRVELPIIFSIVLSSVVASAEQPEPSPFELSAGGEIFADYTYQVGEDESFNAFDLSRAEFGAGMSYLDIGHAKIVLESIRSAGPESLQGIDGNSFVLRLKEASVALAPTFGDHTIGLQAGLIADPWIRALETGYDVRAISPTLSESSTLFQTTDLGVTLSYRFRELATLDVNVANGEGRNFAEQNNGKNTTVVLQVTPELFEGALLRIGAVVREGSTGVSKIRAHRFGGSLGFDHERVRFGIESIYGLGRNDVGVTESWVASAWGDSSIWFPWFGVFLRYDHDLASLERDAVTTTLAGGLYATFAPDPDEMQNRLRLYAGYRGTFPNDEAGPVPGFSNSFDVHSFFLTFEAKGWTQ